MLMKTEDLPKNSYSISLPEPGARFMPGIPARLPRVSNATNLVARATLGHKS